MERFLPDTRTEHCKIGRDAFARRTSACSRIAHYAKDFAAVPVARRNWEAPTYSIVDADRPFAQKAVCCIYILLRLPK